MHRDRKIGISVVIAAVVIGVILVVMSMRPSEEEKLSEEFVDKCKESIEHQKPGAEIDSSFTPTEEVLEGGTRYKLDGTGTLNDDNFDWECNGSWSKLSEGKLNAYASIDVP